MVGNCSHPFPLGTILGGPGNPMRLDVPCPACGDDMQLEYHDVQRRWQASRPSGADRDVIDIACPRCASQLRLTVEADEWRMTLWNFHLVDLQALEGGAGRPLESFHASRYATGWWWSSPGIGSGILECYPGLLRFQCARLPIVGRLLPPPRFEHRATRLVLSSPTMPIPNHFTIVTFERGCVSVSIPGNRKQLRSALHDCGFELVEAPARRSWVRNHSELWKQYGA